MATNFRKGLWNLSDPKITLASMSSILLGACAAYGAGSFSFFWLAVTVLGIYGVEVAKNASGEVFDFDSGVDQAVAAQDRSPFSGGKRVLVDRILTRKQTWAIAAGGYLLAVAAGLSIAAFREALVLPLALGGLFLAYFYHAPPLRLSYRGLGEAAVALAYGPLIAGGTYLVQRGVLDGLQLWPSIPLGLLIAAFLVINEFPDMEADKAGGKGTLVVMFGKSKARYLFLGLVYGALVLSLVLPFLGGPKAPWLGLIAAFPSAWTARQVMVKDSVQTRGLIPAQAATLSAFVFYALGTGAGFLIFDLYP